jgi:predicted NAD/FAD-binding protein
MRIAIVGSGVAALVAAHHLHRRHEVTVFEKDDWVGGHAHTLTVPDGEGEVDLDTGFIVYNERTYPVLTRLFADLGVATQPSDMSFSVGCRRCGVEYSSRGLRGFFAQRRLLLRPSHLRMLRDVLRFHREGTAALDEEILTTTTLGDWIARQGYSPAFVRHFVMPMGAAIWSATPGGFGDIPVHYFLRFFHNHGLLQIDGQPVWRTVVGGSRAYVRMLTRTFADRIHTGAEVTSIRRRAGRVELAVRGGQTAVFDGVVIGAHADQALRLLADPSADETRALAGVPYRANEAILHTDPQWVPDRPAARASWNVQLDDCRRGDAPLVLSYDLNRLQRLTTRRQYCVTLNAGDRIAPEQVLARIAYEHPVYTASTLASQARVRALSGARGTWFCGAYLGFGFHEDGARSGLEVAQAIDAARVAA